MGLADRIYKEVVHSLCNDLNKKCEAIPALHGKRIRSIYDTCNKDGFTLTSAFLIT